MHALEPLLATISWATHAEKAVTSCFTPSEAIQWHNILKHHAEEPEQRVA
jgi:hypothetical protein